MDDYSLDIDLEKKTAIMILPFVTMTYHDKETFGQLMNALVNSDVFIFTVDGNQIIIKVKYDFGVHLNDEVWKVNSSLKNSLSRMMGNDDMNNYFDREIKLALFEHIKKNYFPSVMKVLQKSADEFIKQHSL